MEDMTGSLDVPFHGQLAARTGQHTGSDHVSSSADGRRLLHFGLLIYGLSPILRGLCPIWSLERWCNRVRSPGAASYRRLY